MRLPIRSNRRDDRSHRPSASARGPSRKYRLQLEHLEERKVLSTFTLSESLSGGVPVVRETIDNVTSTIVNPPSPFVVNTPGGSNTVNILDTSAGIAISINSVGSDTVNVGNAGNVQGILGAVTIQNSNSTDTLNVDDSADTMARTATL